MVVVVVVVVVMVVVEALMEVALLLDTVAEGVVGTMAVEEVTR